MSVTYEELLKAPIGAIYSFHGTANIFIKTSSDGMLYTQSNITYCNEYDFIAEEENYRKHWGPYMTKIYKSKVQPSCMKNLESYDVFLTSKDKKKCKICGRRPNALV